jgi:hypothetical protein
MGGVISRKTTNATVQRPSTATTTVATTTVATTTVATTTAATTAAIAADATRGSKPSVTSSSPLLVELPRVAIILACDDYADTNLENLNCCIADAHRVRDVLENQLNFEIATFAMNATLSDFHAAIDAIQLRYDTRTPAQFIFYYAGHGEIIGSMNNPRQQRGYFALSGWDILRRNATGISFSAIKNFACTIGATQQLYIIDSCFSGRALLESRRGRGVAAAAADTSSSSNNSSSSSSSFTNDMLNQPAIFAITAVNGHEASTECQADGGGHFTSAVIAGLRCANVKTSTELLIYIQQRIQEQNQHRITSSQKRIHPPVGGRLLLQHYDKECSGEFIIPPLPALKLNDNNDDRHSTCGTCGTCTTPEKKQGVKLVVVQTAPQVRTTSKHIFPTPHRHRVYPRL